MKTALQTVKKEIAELWSSPGDDPNYTQIFEVLERNESLFRQQIIEAYKEGLNSDCLQEQNETFFAENYYQTTFKTL